MKIVNGWKTFIDEETSKDYFQSLKSFIIEEYNTKSVYPRKGDIFKCFELTDFNNLKLVFK